MRYKFVSVGKIVMKIVKKNIEYFPVFLIKSYMLLMQYIFLCNSVCACVFEA